jgi:hypothetical protein
VIPGGVARGTRSAHEQQTRRKGNGKESEETREEGSKEDGEVVVPAVKGIVL